MKIKKWFYLLLTAWFMLSLGTICSASEKISPDLIKFQGTGWEYDAKGATIFIGTLQNISGKDIEFIGLRCTFYDDKGIPLDHGVVEVRDIGKDGVAKFKFYPSSPVGTASANITEVDVYAKDSAAPSKDVEK